jgi:hypothetical protein
LLVADVCGEAANISNQGSPPAVGFGAAKLPRENFWVVLAVSPSKPPKN